MGLSTTQIYRLASNRILPSTKKAGVGLRFIRKEVDRWLIAGRMPSYKSLDFLRFAVDFPNELGDAVCRGNNKMSKKSKDYEDGFVFVRKTKDGKKRFYINYYVEENGGRIREERVVKKAVTEQDAWVALREKNRELFNLKNHILKPKDSITFKELSKEYLAVYAINKRSFKSDKRFVKLHLDPYFSQMNLKEITSHNVQKYANLRREEGAKSQTVNLELSCLRTIWNIGLKSKKFLMDENPVIKKEHFIEDDDSRKTTVLSREDEKRLLKELPAHQLPIVIVALNTGMRKQELLKLKIEDINFKTSKLTIIAQNSKNKKTDVIPINSLVQQIFKNLVEENSGRSEFIFNYSSNGNYRPLKEVHRGFQSACKKAGIKDLQFRSLRKTFGTRMSEHTSPYALMKLMRHSDVKITMDYYVDVDDSILADAVEKLNGDNGNGQKDENLLNLSGIPESPEIQQTPKPTYLN